MNHLLRSLFAACLVYLTACQKDSDNTGTGPGSTVGETADGRLLSRIVFQYAAFDSAYTDLSYDAVGRWMGNATLNGNPVLNDYIRTRVYRNKTGRPLRYVTFASAADSTVYRIASDGNRLVAKVAVDPLTGTPGDSTGYEYNHLDRIVTARFFRKASAGSPYMELAHAAFDYNDNGNLASMTNLVLDQQNGAGFVPHSNTVFSYDSKTNPLVLGMEALVLDQVFFVSPNNITSIVKKNLANPGTSDEKLTFVYDYHPSNKPRSGKLASGAAPVPMFFRYK